MLYDKAISLAVSDGERNITDLFCGAGTIGISAAKKHPEITVKGVEIVPEAVENARENARINGIDNAVFVCSDANGASVRGSDAVIVDPPRKGIGEKLIKTLSGEKIKKIVYVSCNPETLARDCALLINEGYSMGEVTPFDMFPRTGHVETVVLMSRSTGKE